MSILLVIDSILFEAFMLQFSDDAFAFFNLLITVALIAVLGFLFVRTVAITVMKLLRCSVDGVIMLVLFVVVFVYVNIIAWQCSSNDPSSVGECMLPLSMVEINLVFLAAVVGYSFFGPPGFRHVVCQVLPVPSSVLVRDFYRFGSAPAPLEGLEVIVEEAADEEESIVASGETVVDPVLEVVVQPAQTVHPNSNSNSSILIRDAGRGDASVVVGRSSNSNSSILICDAGRGDASVVVGRSSSNNNNNPSVPVRPIEPSLPSTRDESEASKKTRWHRIRLEAALARDILVRISTIDPSVHARHMINDYIYVESAPIASILRRRRDPHNTSRQVIFCRVDVQNYNFDFETPTEGCTLVEAAKGVSKESGTIEQYEAYRLGHRFPRGCPTWRKSPEEALLNPPLAVDDPVLEVVVQPAKTVDNQAEPVDWELLDDVPYEEPAPTVSTPVAAVIIPAQAGSVDGCRVIAPPCHAVSTPVLNAGVQEPTRKCLQGKYLRPARNPKSKTNYHPVRSLGRDRKPKSKTSAPAPRMMLEVILVEASEEDEQNVVLEESHVKPLAVDDPVWEVVIQPAQAVDDQAEPMDSEPLDEVQPAVSVLDGEVQAITRKCLQSKRLRPAQKPQISEDPPDDMDWEDMDWEISEEPPDDMDWEDMEWEISEDPPDDMDWETSQDPPDDMDVN